MIMKPYLSRVKCVYLQNVYKAPALITIQPETPCGRCFGLNHLQSVCSSYPLANNFLYCILKMDWWYDLTLICKCQSYTHETRIPPEPHFRKCIAQHEKFICQPGNYYLGGTSKNSSLDESAESFPSFVTKILRRG